MLRFFSALVLLLSSCKEATILKPETNFKDSIVFEYLARTDFLEFPDTNAYDFRILKAYLRNDTSFLRLLQKEIQSEKEYAKTNTYFDSCVRLRKISSLNVDEVYRFKHGQSFCYYYQFVTISRKGDSISLHYLEVSGSPDGRTLERRTKNGIERVGPKCKIEKEFTRALTEKDWESLEAYIKSADYWGLKSRNYSLGFDGSSWTVEAFTKRPRYISEQQIHSVYRWSPDNSFKELGLMFMKLAGEKGKCGDQIN